MYYPSVLMRLHLHTYKNVQITYIFLLFQNKYEP